MEASNLLDTEFKTLVISMLNEPKGRLDDLSEIFNKEIVSIKDIEIISKNLSEMKNN